MEISITKTTTPKQKPADESKLGFGQYYTDHMFIMNYDEGRGLAQPRIVPYGPFELDPAAMVLHYAQEIFEGMKLIVQLMVQFNFSVLTRIWQE